jgi:hypothetical protein
MSKDIIISILFMSSLISISIVISLYIYINSKKGIYGTYVDINDKVQSIDSLPVQITLKSLKAKFPGCKSKLETVVCTKGMFVVNGNDEAETIYLENITSGVVEIGPGNIYILELKEATKEQFQDALKNIEE